jgi:tRNA nucleotidyltransferase (CCA-adding enzyme)
MSATDRTPYHTDFVGSRLNDVLRSEIRLLKRFMKGIGVYGAEIKVGGFSGYLCELFTMQYGTFVSVLNAAAAWKKPWIIDYQGHYEDREDEIPKIFEEPLVVVDPVDRGRNVASAVRKECLVEFVAASRYFKLHPSMEFFLPKPPRILSEKQLVRSMEKRGTALAFLKIRKVDTVPDILWGQLYKTQRSLRRMLVQNGFSIIGDAAWSNEADLSVLLFEAEHRFLPATRKHLGPPVEKRLECERFLHKHIRAPATVYGPRLEDERWVVGIKRQYTDIIGCLKTELKHGGRHLGVAELVSKAVANKPDVLANQQIANTYMTSRDFAEFLTQYIQGKPKWFQASA